MKVPTIAPYLPTYLIIIGVFLSTTVAAQQYLYYIFTPKCYNSLIQTINFRDTQCIKLTFSKMMGYALVFGGAIIKIPQVIKILVQKSVYGISFTSLLAQSMTNWVTIVYSWHRGNPFSIYGENAFILVQNILIMLLFILYGKNVPKGAKQPGQNTITSYIVLSVSFLCGMFLSQDPFSWPTIIIKYCMVLQICLFSFARLSQIIHILRYKSTGSLALTTCLLTVLGNLGRMFTVFVEIKEDYMFALSISLATVLNGTILTLFFVYWKNTQREKLQKKKDL